MIAYPRLFEHDAADDQLVKDVTQLVNASPRTISHYVGTRTKKDKEELNRIFTYLPVVMQARSAVGPSRRQAAGDATEPGPDARVVTPRSQATTPRGETPRSSAARQAGAAVVGSPEGQPRFAPSLIPGSLSWKTAHLKKSSEEELQAEQECKERVRLQFAKAGIDPEGRSATDMLRVLYKRHGSTYQAMTSDASIKLTQTRPLTPRSFPTVLTKDAEAQIKHARDLPPTMVSQHLEKEDVAVLGDLCRSFRHFDEKACGSMSIYTKSFTPRGYQEKTGRQPKTCSQL